MLRLQSLNDTDSAYVQFQNKTTRIIDVIWVNYTGGFKKYGTLQPYESINVDTYKTHPWIFVDPKTGVRMKVGQATIFYPLSNAEVISMFRLNTERAVRIPIPIKLPLFTLRQISLQNVLTLLKDMTDIEQLQLPLVLKKDICKINQEKNDLVSKYER